MTTDSRKSLGRLGEQLAAEHFERLGWRIVERNHQTRFGELDLVAVDGDTLVFVEVKTLPARPRPAVGQPARAQAGQVRRIAGLWFNERRGAPVLRARPLRRDRRACVDDARRARPRSTTSRARSERMSLARVDTFALDGVEARRVWVEADIRRGLPAFTVVGLADKAVREARERVRAALANSGFVFPQERITVNLAPAYLRKVGPGFDLPLAVAILAASGQLAAGRRRRLRGRRRAVADRRGARGARRARGRRGRPPPPARPAAAPARPGARGGARAGASRCSASSTCRRRSRCCAASASRRRCPSREPDEPDDGRGARPQRRARPQRPDPGARGRRRRRPQPVPARPARDRQDDARAAAAVAAAAADAARGDRGHAPALDRRAARRRARAAAGRSARRTTRSRPPGSSAAAACRRPARRRSPTTACSSSTSCRSSRGRRSRRCASRSRTAA